MVPRYLGLVVIAWSVLAAVAAAFSCIAAVLHFRPFSSRSRVVRYEPPAGISPSLAAYLRENGRSERALAAGVISLAEQGCLSIENVDDYFRLTSLPGPTPTLVKGEEAALMKSLFHGFSEWPCDTPLRSLMEDFQKTLDAIACPQLLSPHLGLWLAGIVICIISIPLLFLGDPGSRAGDFSFGFILYASIFIAMGVLSLKAAPGAWPATLRKLRRRFPGGTASKLRFTASDLTPLFLTVPALVGFGLLAALTSLQVSVFVALLVIVGLAFRHLLEAPSRKGREVLAQLEEFREFLCRTDSDRLSRQDPRVAHTSEKYGAYAVALGVEKGWREQFTSMLIERVEFELVCDAGSELIGPPLGRTHGEVSVTPEPHPFIELNLRGRK